MPGDIIERYRQLLTQVDAWFAQCLTVAPEQIACARGCSGCCRGLFDITLLDAALLQSGFIKLPEALRRQVLERVTDRLDQLQRMWPQFQPPYILNRLPHQQWMNMPEDDLTPCPLLGEDGLCMVYSSRPLTCRLHGLPNIDVSGEIFSADYCSLNFVDCDPALLPALRGQFRQLFQQEVELLAQFSELLTGRCQTELDTFIPTALIIDFDRQM